MRCPHVQSNTYVLQWSKWKHRNCFLYSLYFVSKCQFKHILGPMGIFFLFLVPWKFKEQNLKLNSVLFFQNYQRDSDSHWLLSGLIIDLERCQSIRELVAERWLINISLKKIDLYTGCASHKSKELKNTDLEHYFSVCSPQESSIKDHLETCYKYRFLSLFQMY